MPQMMPLPWLMVFFLIFVCLYSVFLFLNFYSFYGALEVKSLDSEGVCLPW